MSDALALATDGFLGDGSGDALSLMSEGFLHETVVPIAKPKPKRSGGRKVVPIWCPPDVEPEPVPLIQFEVNAEHFRASAAAMVTASSPVEVRIAAAFALLDKGKDPDL